MSDVNIYLGDCKDVLQTFKNDSIDLCITSPPYGNQRKNTYGGIHPDQYVEWFIPISKEIKRVLNPKGTFILNIKENVVNGERHTYVLELILALKKQGWLWTEEFIWHKKTSMPGRWPNRFRDSWERILQFNKEKDFLMNQDSVLVPTSEVTLKRANRISERDRKILKSNTGSGFRRDVRKMDKPFSYPSNVLHLSTETQNKSHSAVFPLSIPTWFIKLFSNEGDTILDPFAGSGTTLLAAYELNRKSIGIELLEENFKLISENIRNLKPKMNTFF